MTGINEVILNEIAYAVGTNSNTVMNLGIHLGFPKVDVDDYVASNHQSGNVSPTGTKNMLFDWKRNTSSHDQIDKLRKALIKAKLLEIAEKHLPQRDQKLRCLQCDRTIAQITDVISKKNEYAVRSKVCDILGKTCLVQLLKAENRKTGEEYRYDVITMTTADVRVDERVLEGSSFKGCKTHKSTWCKGCSKHPHQIGWYVESTDGNSESFHVVFLRNVIHDTYPEFGSIKDFRSAEKQVDNEANVQTSNPEEQHIDTASSEQVIEDVIRDSIGGSDQQAGLMRIEKYGIEVQFHPSEIWGVDDIQAVPEVPPELVDLLTEDQAIICVGLKASPSDAKFKYPVKVTMPHSAIFTSPDTASIGTYYRKSSSDSFSLINFAKGDPRCVVRKRDLDLYISHFCEWRIFAIITKAFVGKRFICTPFLPEPSPRNAAYLLRLCIRDSNYGKAEPEPGYVAPIKGEEYFVAWRSGDLKVTCKVDNKDIDTKTLEESLFHNSIEVNVRFGVNTSAAGKSQVFVHFMLEQQAKKEIMCQMNLSGNQMTLRPNVADKPTNSSTVTDVHLLKISELLLPAHFSALYVALRIQASLAQSILRQKMNDYPQTYMELLVMWKIKAKRTLKDLDQVLDESRAGGLRSEYK